MDHICDDFNDYFMNFPTKGDVSPAAQEVARRAFAQKLREPRFVLDLLVINCEIESQIKSPFLSKGALGGLLDDFITACAEMAA